MTEGIINADGSRNWQANILLDNIKRLEQEREELKKENERYKYALGKIRKLVQGHRVADEVRLLSIMHYINEVLND